jgi:hypothetical protein
MVYWEGHPRSFGALADFCGSQTRRNEPIDATHPRQQPLLPLLGGAILDHALQDDRLPWPAATGRICYHAVRVRSEAEHWQCEIDVRRCWWRRISIPRSTGVRYASRSRLPAKDDISVTDACASREERDHHGVHGFTSVEKLGGIVAIGKCVNNGSLIISVSKCARATTIAGEDT